mgnify:CR=1 FL=1
MINKIEVIKNVLEQLYADNDDINSEDISKLYDSLDQVLSNYKIDRDEKTKAVMVENSEVINRFIEAKRLEGKTDTTLYNYRNEVFKLLDTLRKNYSEVTTEDIRRYMTYRKQIGRLKSISIQNIRQYLMSFFKWLAREEYIQKNPMDKIDIVKVEQKIIETLTDEEAEIIRCACTCERDLAIIDLLSGSGMRVSELCGLNKDDVNFTTREIIVFGKGGKERVCFMTGRAKVHLKWYLEGRTDNNPALFVTTKKPYNRLTKNGVEYILRTIAKESKIPRTRLYPHKYRSTLATNMINKGAPAEHVQNILGHSSVNTTLKCYCKMDKGEVKRSHTRFS